MINLKLKKRESELLARFKYNVLSEGTIERELKDWKRKKAKETREYTVTARIAGESDAYLKNQ